MNVDFEFIPHGAVSIYDTSIGEKVTMVSPSGYNTGEVTDTKVLVPVYPVTSDLLRATANMLEYAKREDLQSFLIVVSGENVGVIAR